MPRQTDEDLAAALRANLRKRKGQARTPEPSHGTDEEGDVVPAEKADAPGAWTAKD